MAESKISPTLSSLEGTIKRLNLPGYYQSPYYSSSQTALSTLGGQLLTGNLPSYYKDIATPGGGAFEEMLKGITSDITKSVTEDVARRGGRGGLASSVIAREVGKQTTQLRWEDLLRSLETKKGLLGMGADIVSGVRGAGLTESGQKTAFDLSQAQLGLGAEQFEKQFGQGQYEFGEEMSFKDKQLQEMIRQFNVQQENDKKTQKSQMWSSILSSGLGALGTIAGAALAPATGGASLLASTALTKGLGSAGNYSFGGGTYNLYDYLK